MSRFLKQDSGGSGFDDYGGELELHKLGFSHEADGAAGTLLGKVKTRFVTIARWRCFATLYRGAVRLPSRTCPKPGYTEMFPTHSPSRKSTVACQVCVL